MAILHALKNVAHMAKLQMLLPLIQTLVSGDPTRFALDEEHQWMGSTYLQLLIEIFDDTAAPDLNEVGSGSWSTFIRLARFTLADGWFRYFPGLSGHYWH